MDQNQTQNQTRNQTWDRYYRDYAEGLLRWVLSKGHNRHDAEDIVQEAFVRAKSHLNRLEGNPAYLYTIARNLINDRSRARETPSDTFELGSLQGDSPLEHDPEQAALVGQEQVRVRMALDRLRPERREALTLRIFGGLNSAQIGKYLGKKEGTVNVILCRARFDVARELRLAEVNRNDIPERCWNDYIPQLSAYRDGQLKSPRRELVLAHLDRCEHCQAVYAEMQEAERPLRALVPPFLALSKSLERIHFYLTASSSPASQGSDAASRTRIGQQRVGPRSLLTKLPEVIAERVASGQEWVREAFARTDSETRFGLTRMHLVITAVIIALLATVGGLTVAIGDSGGSGQAIASSSPSPSPAPSSHSETPPAGASIASSPDSRDSTKRTPAGGLPAPASNPQAPAASSPQAPAGSVSSPSSNGGLFTWPWSLPAPPPAKPAPAPAPPPAKPAPAPAPPPAKPAPAPAPPPAKPAPAPAPPPAKPAPAPIVDLSVEWQSVDYSPPQGTATWPYQQTLLIKNNGPDTATGVELNIDGPVIFISANQGTCAGGQSLSNDPAFPSSTPIKCTLGSVPNGGIVMVTVRRGVPSSTASAWSKETDINPGNNQATSENLKPG
jgi:RNA polymerase sigma factor (sigma-70 family)